MVANQTESSRLEQRSVIIFLAAEKYKPCKIYGEACFDKKNVYNEAKYRFVTIHLY